jgi:hypothetical protein
MRVRIHVISFADVANLFFSQLGLSTIAAEKTDIVHCCDDLLLPCVNFIIRIFGLSMWADDITQALRKYSQLQQ